MLLTPLTKPRRRNGRRKVKLKHWVIVGLALVGALYVFHNYTAHGGVNGVKSGFGFGGSV